MKYDVPLIPQGTNMGCWAAGIAMILSWQNQASFDPGMIAANPGGLSYVPSLQSGLDPNDRYILERNGFSLEAPQCYAPSAIFDLLTSTGPLWVASLVALSGAGPSPVPHIRVVTGMEGSRLFINDPWPVNRGASYTRLFGDFFGQMESLGARELSERSPVYVAYLEE
jgi:papain like cysteine protease AvrRpt2